MNCPKNLTKDEIILSFGKDDNLGKCNTCDNLVYCDGLMSCKLINESED